MSSTPPSREDFVTGPPKVTEVDFRDFCAEMAAEDKHARRMAERARRDRVKAEVEAGGGAATAGRALYASDNNNKTDDKGASASSETTASESSTSCVCVFVDGAWTPPLAVMSDGRVNLDPDRPEAPLTLLTELLDRQAQTGVELVRFIDT